MIQVERMASLGKLAAVVAHEINNPLASVVTYSRLLLRRFQAAARTRTRQAGENLEILEAIASESARCGEIVSNLLLFARRTGSRFEPTDVNDIVRRSLFLLKHKMDLAQVAGRRPSSPPSCRAGHGRPARRSSRRCWRCAINAIEAMPGGGTLTIAHPRARRDGGVAVEVADTGVGMDEEVRRHIFEPFFTTKRRATARGSASGWRWSTASSSATAAASTW